MNAIHPDELKEDYDISLPTRKGMTLWNGK